MQKKRIGFVDVIRGLAIIIMIMGHLDFGYYFDYYIHSFHMPIWFFIAGWFYRGDKLSFSLVERKARRLILPYLIWGILHYPAWLFLNMRASDRLEPLINLFWINTNLIMPIAGALWFLTCLFFSELIFSFIQTYITHKVIKIFCFITLGLMGYGIPMVLHIRLPWAVDVAFVSIGFILMGYLMKHYKNNCFINKMLNLNLLETILLGGINAVGIFSNGYINLRKGEYSCFILFWLNATLAIIIFWNMSRLIDKKYRNSFVIDEIKFIGKNSMVYLILNQLLVLIIHKVINRIGMSNIFSIYLLKVIGLLIILLILHYTTLVLNKKKFSFLIGK